MRSLFSTWFKRYFSDPEAISIFVVLFLSIIALKLIGNIVAPVILSTIIAYLLALLVKKIEKFQIPHWLAFSSVYLLFLGTVILLMFWLLPLLWQQLINLFEQTPDLVARGQAILLGLYEKYPQIITLTQLKTIIAGLDSQVANFGKFILSFSLASITGFMTAIIYLILVPLLVFFFLKDSDIILKWLSGFLPEKRTAWRQIWDEVSVKTGSYVKGKLVEMLIVSIVSILAFWLLGLQYAILLGSLVGVSVLIPYVGIILVTIPIVIVGLVEWGLTAHFLYLLITYAIIVTLDANVLVPILFSEALNLHPIAIILAVLIFGSLGGFWGVFFAIPLTSLINAILKAWPRN